METASASGGGVACSGPPLETQPCEGTVCVEPSVPPAVAASLAEAGIEVRMAEEPAAFATAAIDAIPFFLTNLTLDEKMAMGHTLMETVPMCTYNGVRCPLSDFKTFYDEALGNCFTFNHEMPAMYRTQRPGALTGLALLLQSAQSDYLCTSQLGGFKVVVHNQTERPFADSDGFNIAPGTSTSVGLSQQYWMRKSVVEMELAKQPPPYGACALGPSAEFLYEGGHTMEGCLRSCYQAVLGRLCGCADPRYALPDGARPCAPGKDKLCLDKYLNCRPENKTADPLACEQCEDPCVSFQYQTTVSTGAMVETEALMELAKQPPPYGACALGPSAEFLYEGGHTMEGCLRSCCQAVLGRLCGCADPRYALPDGARPCAPGKDKLCLDKYLNCRPENKTADPLACEQCEDPCVSFQYQTTVSTGAMVETEALKSVCAFGAEGGTLQDSCENTGTKRRNFAEVHIYYEQLNMIRHTQIPAYEGTNLISDVAGVLGITMGLSVLTMTEFVFALLDIVFHLFTKHSFLK